MPDVEIEVITTLPNRYATFNPDALELEEYEKLRINRVKLSKHESGMCDQAQAFIYYARKVMHLIKENNYDLVFATSSRLMTAVLGTLISKTKKIPLYLDIRDLFVDALRTVLLKKGLYLAYPFFSLIEGWSFKQATRINLVSLGFKSYFDKMYPNKELRFFTNGIDEEFITDGPLLKSTYNSGDTLNIFYAGNIGEGQGLHLIIPFLAKQLEGRAVFTILGDGGKKSKLKEAIEKEGCSNVKLLPPVDRKTLMKEYHKADVLFLHLNNHEAFKKVLPSKLFEYAALGKPIWAGVSGYPAEFIHQEISNAVVFEPCNYIQAIEALADLKYETKARDEFVAKYSRRHIMQEMSQDIKLMLYQQLAKNS